MKLVGVVHLPPMPGYKDFPGMSAIIDHAITDVSALHEAGYDGALLENENDTPHKITATPEIIAAMTLATTEAQRQFPTMKVGAEFLLNDPIASLAITHAAKGAFIRTDYFVDRMFRPGIGDMAIHPEALIAYRDKLKSNHIQILADIQVKYAEMIEPRPLRDSAIHAREARADGIIVTAGLTGQSPTIKDLTEAKEAVGDFPIWIGSGLTAENAQELFGVADAALVGTGIMKNGRIDLAKASRLRDKVSA